MTPVGSGIYAPVRERKSETDIETEAERERYGERERERGRDRLAFLPMPTNFDWEQSLP